MSFFAARFEARRRDLAAFCGSLAVVGGTATASAQCLDEHVFGSGGFFGWSAAISGDTVIVGAPSEFSPTGGAAYVFVRSSGAWTQQAHLVASDGVQYNRFGRSVAIDGDTAVVGAGTETAYVFVRSGGAWTEQARLVNPDPEYGEFGIVAISGNTIVVGAYLDRSPAGYHAGSAYVFVNNGGEWSEQANLFASDGGIGYEFGRSVAIDGDTVVVGSVLADSAYIFLRSGGVWTQQARLNPSVTPGFDAFGACVAIDGDTALVGAYYENTPGGVDTGSAYVFVRSGGVWTEQAHLFASDAAADDHFGFSAAMSDNTIVVGAPDDDRAGVLGTGSAYVFVRSGGVWTQRAHLFAPDGAQGNGFGSKVGISGNTALVCDAHDFYTLGSAYVFDLGCCSGNLDGSAAVDLSDLAILLANFGAASGATLADGDFDSDGDVDLGDLANMLSVIGTTCS